MLEPDGRAALTEQLRPPSGYTLRHAVVTTFTLDLTTALSVPLAFAAHRARESRDPISILDAVRRAADRIDIFAQAGQVFEPRVHSDLFAFLEPMVHPVQAPYQDMLFHPKVWVLEYSDGETCSYRILCASRNLTNDRSWDLLVRLDGIATDGPTEQSAPLAAFVHALPALCVQPLVVDRTARIEELAAAVACVEWERPTDVRSVTFHPYGIPGLTPQPLDSLFDGTRHAIISPFLSDDGIRRIIPPRSTKITVLVRRDQLDRLDTATLARIEVALLLDDAANDDDTAGDDQVDGQAASAMPTADALVGLHAKAYVLDRRTGSHLFIGSANATEAAFGGNVEMLVEFEGSQSKLGVEAVLGEQSRLRALTIPFEPEGNIEVPDDELADYALDQALRRLAARRYAACVEPDTERDNHYCIEVSADEPLTLPVEMTARVALLTRRASTGAVPGDPVVFDGLELADVTPFIVIQATDGRSKTAATVVSAELIGDVSGRRDAVIARQLADRAAFVRLLALLLALEDGQGTFQLDTHGTLAGGWAEDGSGIFETLVRAIGVEHPALADVRRIVEHVRVAEHRRERGMPSVLPEGFNELWESVWAAYTANQQAATS
jgi:hypothetical protein